MSGFVSISSTTLPLLSMVCSKSPTEPIRLLSPCGESLVVRCTFRGRISPEMVRFVALFGDTSLLSAMAWLGGQLSLRAPSNIGAMYRGTRGFTSAAPFSGAESESELSSMGDSKLTVSSVGWRGEAGCDS